MMHKSMKFYSVLLTLFVSTGVFAQQQDPEEEAKKLYEAIQEQVDKYANSLDLEDWQIFYVDSIFTHDYTAIQEEFNKMKKARVSNIDLYATVQDEWNENMYQAMQRVLNDEQWTKYLKMGAAREKKARDKRAAKKK